MSIADLFAGISPNGESVTPVTPRDSSGVTPKTEHFQRCYTVTPVTHTNDESRESRKIRPMDNQPTGDAFRLFGYATEARKSPDPVFGRSSRMRTRGVTGVTLCNIVENQLVTPVTRSKMPGVTGVTPAITRRECCLEHPEPNALGQCPACSWEDDERYRAAARRALSDKALADEAEAITMGELP